MPRPKKVLIRDSWKEDGAVARPLAFKQGLQLMSTSAQKFARPPSKTDRKAFRTGYYFLTIKHIICIAYVGTAYRAVDEHQRARRLGPRRGHLGQRGETNDGDKMPL